jgi:RNA polymerase sigma factor (sigma-70 family)
MARTSSVGVPVGAAARCVGSPSDADAVFRDLYAEHGPALLRLTTAVTGGDRGRVEDLVQETMLRAWTHRDNSDLQHRSPRAWLMTTARRLAIDAHRAQHARPLETELTEDLSSPAASRPRPASMKSASRRPRRSATFPAPGPG